MKKTIYLVRHGENRANIEGIFSCKNVDFSLTDKGMLQAQQTAEYFKDKNVTAVYSSPLKRAQETAGCIATRTGVQVKILESLREINVGDLEGKKVDMENFSYYMDILNRWFSGDTGYKFPGGEDYDSLTERFRSSLDTVVKEDNPGSVVIVGHKGIFTYPMHRVCRNVTREYIESIENHNCSISVIESEIENGEISYILKEWAYSGHMSGTAADFVHALPKKRT